ncbi:MAG: fructoselysine 6-kinase [Clostridiales Family XIII bacterium]|jgi:fructoselysine 6-kinase|nr:fructoselysine 6-kinase [Clostridiales Family XIII bacterium]
MIRMDKTGETKRTKAHVKEISVKFAAIGDNCFDVYSEIGIAYPTGNAVDTAVHMRKLGVPTALISTAGNDAMGRRMLDALRKIGLDLSHFHIADGPTAITYMEMDGTDRVHVKYVEGVLGDMRFDEEDFRFAATHDFVHATIWGKADHLLPGLKKMGVRIGFDYSDRLSHPAIASTAPYVDYGFFSYADGRDAFIERYMIEKAKEGIKTVVVTMGANGSLCYHEARFTACPAFPANIVNTVGAGDGFIAGFLHGAMTGKSVSDCLSEGAEIAAGVISQFAPWCARENDS